MKTLGKINILQQVMDFGYSLTGRSQHPRQVCRLCCMLFEGLQPVHKMGNTERIWLQIAAVLHDIGKSLDKKNHNKRSRDLIVAARNLPVHRKERKIIGLIARYHRGPLPKKSHKYYRDFNSEQRSDIRKLAALLRLADGLDPNHKNLVRDLLCETDDGTIRIYLQTHQRLNLQKAKAKSDLAEKVYGRIVKLIEENELESMFDVEKGQGRYYI
jgi:exopolyphosphatase/guanosine-5'-triphosphate,3'-diphosphate pyrophosphatase